MFLGLISKEKCLAIEAKVTSCDAQTKLEQQLHEQYAINNNANMSSFVSIMVALITAIGAFGYVLIQTQLPCLHLPTGSKTIYSVQQFYMTYMGSLIVLSILFCICTYQGIAQRKEQFIIFDIRRRNGLNDNLPKGYHPFCKHNLAIIQGLYGEQVKIYIIIAFIQFIITIGVAVIEHSCADPIMWVSILVTIIAPIICYQYYIKNRIIPQATKRVLHEIYERD